MSASHVRFTLISIVLGLSSCSSESEQPAFSVLDSGLRRPNVSEANVPKLKSGFATALDQVRSGDTAGMTATLRSIAPHLPQVEASQEGQPLLWYSAPINKIQPGFYAFRFKSPIIPPGQLHWIFTADAVTRWYIVPVRGEIQGFRTFHMERNVVIDGIDLPKENTVCFQSLLGRQIQGGKEYIIWAVTKADAIVDMKLALQIGVAPSHANTSAANVAKALGINWHPPTKVVDKAAINAAWQTATRLAQRQRYRDEKFLRSLRSMAHELPLIDVATGEEAAPLAVVNSEAERPFFAFRFKSPLDEDGDLRWAFAVESEIPDWGFFAVEGTDGPLDETSFHVEVNLSMDGLPTDNLVAFQTLLGGQIKPGKEYVVFTRPHSPTRLWAALRVIPAGSGGLSDSSRKIAETLGWQLPEAMSESRVRATLLRCYRRTLSGDTGFFFQTLLRSAASGIPELEVGQDDVVWNDVTFAAAELPLRAAKITIPPGDSLDIHWAFAKPYHPTVQWGIVPTFGKMESLPPRTLQDVPLEGVDLPEQNRLVLQTHQNVLGGQEVLVWFLAREPEPAEIKTAFRVTPTTPGSRNPSSYRIAYNLGLQLPVNPAPPGSVLLEGHDRGVIGAAFVDGSSLITADRAGSVRMWDVDDQSQMDVVETGATEAEHFVLSPDSTHFAIASDGVEIQVWSLNDKERVARIELRERVLETVALSADGQLAAAMARSEDSQSPAMLIWDVATQETLFGRGIGVGTTSLWFDIHDRFFVAGRKPRNGGFGEGRLIQFDLSDQSFDRRVEFPYGDLVIAEPSNDGNAVILATRHGLLQIVDAKTVRVTGGIVQSQEPTAAAITNDRRLSAVAFTDGTIKLWDSQAGRLTAMWRVHSDVVRAMDASPDGQWFVSAGEDTSVRLWPTSLAVADGNAPELSIKNSVEMTLNLVSDGVFTMGTDGSVSNPGGRHRSAVTEGPAHKVTISKPFYMGRHEVTVHQFHQFVEATDYRTAAEQSGGGRHRESLKDDWEQKAHYTWRYPGFIQLGHHPVTQITLEDAVAFCKWLSDKEGVTYRLPTEAEWEYACRAGSRTTFFGGDSSVSLLYSGNTASRDLEEHADPRLRQANVDKHQFTSPVGTFHPNAFGLFDMHGNVFEFCSDYFDPDIYGLGDQTDPRGPDTGTDRLARGGSWMNPPWGTRATRRERLSPGIRLSVLGFRVVREIP